MASIESQLPAGDALRKLARAQLARLARELAAAETGAHVHSLRKRLKFLRSLLRLVKPAIGDDAFRTANAHLKSAADNLATKRREEAMAEAIGKLRKHADASSPVLAELETAANARSVHAKTDHAASLAAARSEIDAVRALVGGWRLPKRDARLYMAGLRRCYGRARRLMIAGLSTGEVDTLHEARKSVIHHLHHLEILKPTWPDLIGVWCDELGKLRELLGDLHDLDELQRLLDDAESPFGGIASRAAAHQLIAARRERIIQRIRRRAAQIFAERPRPLTRRLGLIWAAWEDREAAAAGRKAD